jgi:hypothetical protein
MVQDGETTNSNATQTIVARMLVKKEESLSSKLVENGGVS